MTERKHSALYRHIEQEHGERPWGALLDAGTGVNSLRWVAQLETTRWTAVTGSSREAARVGDAIETARRPQDQIVVGNWTDPQLLHGEVYDTVIADYLLGAIEGFAPFFQPYLFGRLRPLIGGRVYVTGLEPYVPTDRPDSEAGRVVWEIGRFRDACVLLTGGMPYREYPLAWVLDQMKRAGFTVGGVKRFPIAYKARFVDAQIAIAEHVLDGLLDHALAQALKARGAALRAQALEIIGAEGALRGCQNYVIAAEPA